MNGAAEQPSTSVRSDVGTDARREPPASHSPASGVVRTSRPDRARVRSCAPLGLREPPIALGGGRRRAAVDRRAGGFLFASSRQSLARAGAWRAANRI